MYPTTHSASLRETHAEIHSAREESTPFALLEERYAVRDPIVVWNGAFTGRCVDANEQATYPQCYQGLGLGWCCRETYTLLS